MASRCSDRPAEAGSYREFRRGRVFLTLGRFRLQAEVTAIALLLTAAAGLAQPPTDQQRSDALARRAADRIAALQKEAESLATQEKTLLGQLRKLELDRLIQQERLAQLDREVADVQAKIADAGARAASLQQRAELQRPDVEARLVQLYKMGRAGYWRLLLDVDSLREVGRVYRTASALTHINRDRIEEHRRTLASLDGERKALEGRAADLARLRADAEQARLALARAVTARSALVASIDQRRDLNAQLTGELQDAQQKLQASLSQLAGGRGAAPASLPIRPFQGALPWPADGVVMVRFGQNPRRGGMPMRNGIELSLREGETVRAVHEGTVAFAEPFSGYGNMVIVDHGDKCFSLYGHLQRMSVHRGDRIEQGTTVGLAGRNPAGNPSLYLELRIDGKAVDPLQWLKRP